MNDESALLDIFEYLRTAASDFERELFSLIWSYFVEHNQGISTQLVHHKYGKVNVTAVRQERCPGTLVEASAEGKQVYVINLSGVLLSQDGEALESLLVRYLEYARDLWLENPERGEIPDSKIGDDLKLSESELAALGQAIRSYSFANGSRYSPDDKRWGVHLPLDVDEYPEIEDFHKYVRIKAMATYPRQRIVTPVLSSDTAPAAEGATVDSTAVFVVFGRDAKVKEALFAFLQAIGLHPIEWAEAVEATGKTSPYTGEVLDAGFRMAQAVVVLLTPDDEAHLRPHLRGAHEPEYETRLTPQARPNVLFEAGMAMGSHQDRTVIVEVGNLRPFSDVAGRNVVRMDNSAEKRNALVGRLKVAGCATRTSGERWLSVGDFTVTEAPASAGQVANPSSVVPMVVVNNLTSTDEAVLNAFCEEAMAQERLVTLVTKAVRMRPAARDFDDATFDGALRFLDEQGCINQSIEGLKTVYDVTLKGFQSYAEKQIQDFKFIEANIQRAIATGECRSSMDIKRVFQTADVIIELVLKKLESRYLIRTSGGIGQGWEIYDVSESFKRKYR